MKQSKTRGFTLIEMLVVVAIIGLLASVVIVGLGDARKKARDARRLSEVNSIRNWAEANYNSALGGYQFYSGSRQDPLIAFPAYWNVITDVGEFEIGACMETSEYADGGINCPGDVLAAGQNIAVDYSGVGQCETGFIYCISSAQ